MALKKEILKILEDIVGVENISDDPVILESYTRIFSGRIPRFAAVVLPQHTNAVQMIVRLCNRYKIKYTASSTGWLSGASGPDILNIDLRRMNRIIEINEKNMYAVVEPYVIGAQLQAELMKKGFNYNVTGAGSTCSALPLAAHEGLGHMSLSLSYGDRNLLGVEWVTPDGEIVRLGALGSTGEWFCGDGPGPSLRGVLRGHVTPMGGLGIFTKAAQKIYHWPGPSVFPIQGVSPHYSPSRIPDNFMIRYISFPSFEERFEALRRIGESEIGFEAMCFAPSMISANIATNNREDLEYLEQISQKVQGPGFQIIIVGNSINDFEYKKKVLEIILDETNGQSLSLMEDPEIGGGQLWRCIRITASIRETMRATGFFDGFLGGFGPLKLMLDYITEACGIKADLIGKGAVIDDGVSPFGQPVEHMHFGHSELLNRLDPKQPGTEEAFGAAKKKLISIGLKGKYGILDFVSGDDLHNLYGAQTCNYQNWIREIKKAFDPNRVAESSAYITVKNN